MNSVRLDSFDNSWYKPGRSAIVRALWFFVGAPLVRASLLPSSQIRIFLLRLFGARIGDGVVLKPGIRIKYPWRLSIGDNCWIGEDSWLDTVGNISLGCNVCISQAAYLCTGNHDWKDPAFGLIVKDIILRDGSWVGAKAVICPGVELGHCAVAAAGSVISKNVPSFEIHGGNPATFLRIRDLSIAGIASKSCAVPLTIQGRDWAEVRTRDIPTA
jgi:putative colanic acid biosynthesis acetyltransferase WcaF